MVSEKKMFENVVGQTPESLVYYQLTHESSAQASYKTTQP